MMRSLTFATPMAADSTVTPHSRSHRKFFRRAAILIAGWAVYVATLTSLWYVSVRALGIPKYLIPSPEDVIRSLMQLPGYYAYNFAITGMEAALGLLWGFSAGVMLGVLLRYGGLLGRLLSPLILAVQVFPMFAIAPLLTSYLGYGMAPKILITGLIVLLPAVVNTWRGLSATPREVRLALHVMGANAFQRAWYGDRVFAIPQIMSAWRISSTYCVVGAAVGEFSGGSSAGLAHVILTSLADLGTPRTYASLVLLALMGGIFYGTAIVVDRLFFHRYQIHVNYGAIL